MKGLLIYTRCLHCNRQFDSLTKRQVYCSVRCRKAARAKLIKREVVLIPCECCGEDMEELRNRRVHPYVCKPKPGFTQVCVRCREAKPYEEYYDYRYNVDGKLHTACKECVRSATLKRFHKKRVDKQKGRAYK